MVHQVSLPRPRSLRVLLTGASGFIGSHLLTRLVRAQHCQVAILLRDPGSAWRIHSLLDRVTIIPGSMMGLDAVRLAVCSFQPNVVIHLAWNGVAGRYRNDRSQLANIDVTWSLANLASEAGADHWIGLGSQAEYGPQIGPLNEDAPCRPTTLYGIAKLAAGLAAAQRCRNAAIPFTWLRLFSAYGPQDDPGWMLPKLIRCLLAGKRPALTWGTQIWDYLYVDDVARAIEHIAATPTAVGIFNLGSGQPRTIRQMIELVRDRIDPRLPLGFGEVPFRPDQVMHLEADISRLHAATGWTPQIDLAEGIDRTIDHARHQMFPS